MLMEMVARTAEGSRARAKKAARIVTVGGMVEDNSQEGRKVEWPWLSEVAYF